ncbi:MAG: DUF364 domain-containing protein [Candidatus Bathyarchaeota archaeon]|uniref:DUF364 domain-containing protein n=1 Tax=Candidatus Bathycorpusculum sp. TaxID=2994959 RepID=UPI002828CC40|nr:DUF364 domain-containing protein [Candidatus Termiticorpusculum sp.]MCL2257628.1 DUF364 domain-containing protein [Candidatus Termiticorpusculum sp.]MCL2292237.1 DUF364 domain-containing protein [Candidatus Termiticorpusculum sp.]
MNERIVEEALKRVKMVAGVDDVLIEQVVLGLGYTGVRLSTGHIGLCYTFQPEIAQSAQHCQVSDLAGTLVGTSAIKLAEKAQSWDLRESVVGFATLNALSQSVIEQNLQNYVISNGDVIDSISLHKTDVTVLVGYIVPMVPYIRSKVKELYILERTASRREEGIFPDTACDQILPKADVVLITGTAIVNGTIDHLLELTTHAREVAVIGASAGIIPEVLFNRGVTIMGGIKITDAVKVMQIVSEGGGTPALKSAMQFVSIKPNKHSIME